MSWDEDIGPFQRRRTYRVETRGQDAILSYWFNTDEGDGGLVGRSCGVGPVGFIAFIVFSDAMLNSSNSRHVRFVSPYVILHFGSTTLYQPTLKTLFAPFWFHANIYSMFWGVWSGWLCHWHYHTLSLSAGWETKRVRPGPIPVAFIYHILHDHDTYIPA